MKASLEAKASPGRRTGLKVICDGRRGRFLNRACARHTHYPPLLGRLPIIPPNRFRSNQCPQIITFEETTLSLYWKILHLRHYAEIELPLYSLWRPSRREVFGEDNCSAKGKPCTMGIKACNVTERSLGDMKTRIINDLAVTLQGVYQYDRC